MPGKTKSQVIGRVRPAAGVISKKGATQPMMPSAKSDSALRAENALLRQDLKSLLDLVSEILDEQGLTSSDIDAKSHQLRQRWGIA